MDLRVIDGARRVTDDAGHRSGDRFLRRHGRIVSMPDAQDGDGRLRTRWRT